MQNYLNPNPFKTTLNPAQFQAILAPTISQQDQRSSRQISLMMREDYQCLIYRKMNLIIMLQQSEQIFSQRENQMANQSQLSTSHPQTQQQIHSAVYLTQSIINHKGKLRKHLKLCRRQAQITIQQERLQTQKKCLMQQLIIFVNQVKQIALQHFQTKNYIDSETVVKEQGRRYNLATTVNTFIEEIKVISAGQIAEECARNAIKSCESMKSKHPFKIEEIRGNSFRQKNKTQVLDDILLYLKEFKSTAIFKQFSVILKHFISLYDKTCLKTHYLYIKMNEQMIRCLQTLFKIKTQSQVLQSQMQDCRIQIQILKQKTKIVARQIEKWQKISSENIELEALQLSQEYSAVNTQNQHQSTYSSFTHRKLEDNTSYFKQMLRKKYQQYVQKQLQQDQHLQILRQKIEQQSKIIQFTKNTLLTLQESNKIQQEQLLTHRSLEQTQKSLLRTIRGSQMQINTIQNSLEASILQNINENYLSCQNSSRGHQQQRSHFQMSNKFTQILKNLSQKQEPYLVRRQISIRNNKMIIPVNPSNSQNSIFELKLTKKYLILQEISNNSLRLNQKMEINRLKNYKIDAKNQSIYIQYGFNSINLQFINHNTEQFANKIAKIITYPNREKQNRNGFK